MTKADCIYQWNWKVWLWSCVWSFVEFKSLIKNWKLSDCPRRLYIQRLLHPSSWFCKSNSVIDIKWLRQLFLHYIILLFKFCSYSFIFDLVYIKIYFCFIVNLCIYYLTLIYTWLLLLWFNFRVVNFMYFKPNLNKEEINK